MLCNVQVYKVEVLFLLIMVGILNPLVVEEEDLTKEEVH